MRECHHLDWALTTDPKEKVRTGAALEDMVLKWFAVPSKTCQQVRVFWVDFKPST
jgi:hypothetical protein